MTVQRDRWGKKLAAVCGANGKMGHTVASCIDGRDDCTVIGGVDSYTAKYADFPIVATPAELPEVPDVIIDFSNPSTLDELLEYALVSTYSGILYVQHVIRH